MSNLQITFFGGVGSVTGANFILQNNSTKIAVDCGLLQGTADADAENAKTFPYDPSTLDFLFITHAHMDHIGKVAKLVKDGFKGLVYSTPETKELSQLMLSDALQVMQIREQSEHLCVSNLTPNGSTFLYDQFDLSKTFSLWQTIPYHAEKKLTDEISVFVMDAGHILGSAMYKFTCNNKKIVFTGDSGNSPAPLLRDTDKITDADYLIMDSVYGDRNHEPKDERDEKFRRIVTETISAGGTLLIPAFSLERTQVILYELNNLIEDKKIPSVPVFLDAPLGEKVTEVYKKYTKDFNAEVQSEIKSGDDIFNFPKLNITHGHTDSMKIAHTPNPKIIIAGSGMSSGGRVLGHEINVLPDPKSTLLLMGYQALGTLGRTLQNKPKSAEIPVGRNSETQTVRVNARIEMISGYSSHKDLDHLVEMVGDTTETVKKVFVVMGEPSASTFLVQRLREFLDVDAVYPERGKVYELN